jgi:hypothetical protein
MIELTSQTDEERALIIDAVMNRGGIIEAVFEMLRRLPRRILMVLKLVSRSTSAGIRMIIMRVERPYKVAISRRMRAWLLTGSDRNLDHSLDTTHPEVRMYVSQKMTILTEVVSNISHLSALLQSCCLEGRPPAVFVAIPERPRITAITFGEAW